MTPAWQLAWAVMFSEFAGAKIRWEEDGPHRV
jgi:hypothetical protein